MEKTHNDMFPHLILPTEYDSYPRLRINMNSLEIHKQGGITPRKARLIMNKSELINALSEETVFSKKDIAKVLAAFTRIVERTLKKGEKVSLTGFGTYWISRRPARVGINPATKERINLPAIAVPRFKPGKHLKEQVRFI